MEHQNFESDDERFDQATSARLSKLRTMPVDTSRLERLIQMQIPKSTGHRSVIRMSYWLRPMRAIAASVLIAGISAAIWMMTTTNPVDASTTDMIKFHDDLVSGRVPVTHVDSVEQADAAIRKQWAESPRIPNVPMDHFMACCMRDIKNRKVACVLLEGADGPVTMTVANASDMQAPKSPIVVRAGITYYVQTVGNLHMVMTERNQQWVCLIASSPVDKLMDLASTLEF